MATLLVVRGPGIGTQFVIGETPQRIGRDAHCDIHFDDTETSRSHAEVSLVNGNAIIRDLSSSNGTIVNGAKIKQHILAAGDRVQIGKRLLVYRPSAHSGSSADSEVDIVASDDSESSQIVGRAELDGAFDSPMDGTGIWHPNPELELQRAESARGKSTWEIMYRTSLAVSRTLDIDQLLRQILELIFQWVECDRGCIMLSDTETNELRPSCRKFRRSTTAGRMSISKTILDYVLKNEEGVLTSDAGDDRRWDASASIASSGIREAICVPMRGRYGMVGVIYIDTSMSPGDLAASPNQRIFNEEHLKMLVTVGHQAALAIEDTNYYQSMLQAERLAAIGQTIATLSHHVKNIVQGLRGGGFMISEGLKRNELATVESGWRICERTHERIESLVLDMLTISKERKPERQSVDLRNVIDDVVELCQTQSRENQIPIEWQKPGDFPSMSLDGEAIYRAILNLVSNAMDACANGQDGKVVIRLTKKSDAASIQVQDNGVGIPESDLQKIFSLFESTKGNRGTGLGLPVSLKIAREHGGSIHVKSVVGSGTTFEFVLPWRANLPAVESKTISG